MNRINEKALLKPLVNSSKSGRNDFIKNASFSLLLEVLKDTASASTLADITESCIKYLTSEERKKSQHLVSSLKVCDKALKIANKRKDADAVWSVIEKNKAEDVLNQVSQKYEKTQSITSRVQTIQSEIAAGMLLFQDNKKQETEHTPKLTGKKTKKKKSSKKNKK